MLSRRSASIMLSIGVAAGCMLVGLLASPVAVVEAADFSSRQRELMELAETRQRAVRLLIDLRFEDRLLDAGSVPAYRAQKFERARMQPLAQDDQHLLVAALAQALSRPGQHNWSGVRAILEIGEYYRIDEDDFVALLRQLLLIPRAEKISQAHGRSLMLALQAAGRGGTSSAMDLLEEATSLTFWESAGPVRATGLSTDTAVAVQILRLNAIGFMGLMGGDLARPVLHSIRDAYDSQRSQTGLPQSESRFEHWAANSAEEALASIARREEQAELRSAAPKPEGGESERLHRLRGEGEARVDAAFERLLARIYSQEMSATIESEIVQEMYAARAQAMAPEDAAFVAELLGNEAAKVAPHWPLVHDALHASLYGAASGDDFARILRLLLEHPREGHMSEAQVKSLFAALTAAAYTGTPAAVELMRDATTREFWTASGMPRFPDSMVASQFRDEFSGVGLLMEHAVKAMAHAPPELVRDILVAIHDEHRGHFAAASDVAIIGVTDFDALAAKAAAASLQRLALREGAPSSP